MIQEDELIRRAKRLIKRYDDMRIVGGGGEWSGSARQGFAFNPKPIGVGTSGVIPPPPQTGACCFDDGTCTVETATQCAIDGGTYQGDGTDCDPNPCPQPSGVCCWHGECLDVTPEFCLSIGGTVSGAEDCLPNPCPGACCFDDDTCTQLAPSDCVDAGGTFMGGDCHESTCGFACQCCCSISHGTDWYCYVSNLFGCPDPQGAYRCNWCNFETCFDDDGDSTCEPGGGCCYFSDVTMEWVCQDIKQSICYELGGTFYGNNFSCTDPLAPHCPPE